MYRTPIQDDFGSNLGAVGYLNHFGLPFLVIIVPFFWDIWYSDGILIPENEYGIQLLLLFNFLSRNNLFYFEISFVIKGNIL